MLIKFDSQDTSGHLFASDCSNRLEPAIRHLHILSWSGEYFPRPEAKPCKVSALVRKTLMLPALLALPPIYVYHKKVTLAPWWQIKQYCLSSRVSHIEFWEGGPEPALDRLRAGGLTLRDRSGLSVWHASFGSAY